MVTQVTSAKPNTIEGNVLDQPAGILEIDGMKAAVAFKDGGLVFDATGMNDEARQKFSDAVLRTSREAMDNNLRKGKNQDRIKQLEEEVARLTKGGAQPADSGNPETVSQYQTFEQFVKSRGKDSAWANKELSSLERESLKMEYEHSLRNPVAAAKPAVIPNETPKPIDSYAEVMERMNRTEFETRTGLSYDHFVATVEGLGVSAGNPHALTIYQNYINSPTTDVIERMNSVPESKRRAPQAIGLNPSATGPVSMDEGIADIIEAARDL